MTTDYQAFLESKAQLAQPTGLDVDPAEVHPLLKPHQRDAVVWAVAGGRRALFESFGLGKTMQQLEAERLVLGKLGGGRGLIVCPLGVRQEFARDAAMLGIDVTFIRSAEDARTDGIYLTNYETIREQHLDPTGFDVVSLDEAAILRGFGGSKTFREFMRLYEGTANYRFVATATPSPNEYIELLSYAAFLDIMDVGQAKTRFFKRDSQHADRLTLLPHMEREFWLWVSSWALFMQKPSDLGHPDDGYELPPLDVRWHEIPSTGPADDETDRDGRGVLFRNAALGVQQAAREKRDSLDARVAKAAEIVATVNDPQAIVWCDLNDEQRALERALTGAGRTYSSLTGSQPIEDREQLLDDWRKRATEIFLSKPSMYGAGVNLQQAHTMIFTGIGFKFSEVIQAVHRVHRFLQDQPVTVHLIYTDAEQQVRSNLERKWQQHNELVAQMGGIIRRFGLSRDAIAQTLTRSIGVERVEVTGDRYRLANNDSVLETSAMGDGDVDLIVTSIPFSTQYEYTPSYNDFGHTDDNEHFWRQMDYLTPQLLRVLAPGRNAIIHVKDRIVPGGMNGLGFQTVEPFHAEAISHYRRHGFAFLGMKTIVTDVVRENNQTYRLGWTEQCKDGSRMGAGMPEYLLLFRKPPTDLSNGYADKPVVKSKAWFPHECNDCASCGDHEGCYDGDCCQAGGYSRTRWQIDAHGFARSSGNRPLTPRDLAGIPHEKIFKLFRDHNLGNVYDFETHVQLGESLEASRRLPTTFMLLQPPSWHPDVWTDIARMRTLNMLQERRGQQQHLCPLPFDIVDRLIAQFSMPGETVYDPFAGLMTVPYCAVKAGRRGIGVELNPDYFRDGVAYVESAAAAADIPTLFDLIEEAS